MHVIHCKDDGTGEEQCSNRQRIYGNQVCIFLHKFLKLQRTTTNDLFDICTVRSQNDQYSTQSTFDTT
jgi:hypothetical protein